MTSKNLLLTLIMIAAGITTTMAQLDNSSKFYIKAYGGYGLITPGSYRLVSSSNDPATNTGNTSQSSFGMGSGIRAGGGLGVIASDFLNIGVDVEYLSGATLKSSSNYPGDYTYQGHTEISYHTLSIIPNVMFKALSKPNYLIYNKLGILLNLPTELNKISSDTSYNPGAGYTYADHVTGKYKTGLTAGLNVAIGVQIRLTDNLRAFGEVFGNFLVLSPKTYDEVNTSVNNGSPAVINNTHIDYIKNGKTAYTSVNNSNNGTNTTYSQNVVGSTFNMNTVGLNIGVSYRF